MRRYGYILGLAALLSFGGGDIDCSQWDSGLINIRDLSGFTYGGVNGGLWLDGSNDMPQVHIDTKPNPRRASGDLVVATIGMSNARSYFCGNEAQSASGSWDHLSLFGKLVASPGLREDLVLINGARGGQTATTWSKDYERPGWQLLDGKVQAAGLANEDVDVFLINLANVENVESLPLPSPDASVYKLIEDLHEVIDLVMGRYPNVSRIYMIGREYGGYSTTYKSPEPFAYESNFAAKHVILDRLGTLPWVTWGPDIWTNGLVGREWDGFAQPCEHFEIDGIHPTDPGMDAISDIMLEWFDANEPDLFFGSPCYETVHLLDYLADPDFTVVGLLDILANWCP